MRSRGTGWGTTRIVTVGGVTTSVDCGDTNDWDEGGVIVGGLTGYGETLRGING